MSELLANLFDEISRGISVESNIWEPLPGPQTMAYNSPAFEVFYGGAAGGGKTDLLLGVAATGPHKKSIIYRREYPQLKDVVSRGLEIFTDIKGATFNQNKNMFMGLPGDRTIELGSVPHFGSVSRYKGRPHSLKGFDELPDFSKEMYTFLIGWTRSTNPNERTRVIACGNPPTSSEGIWVVERWGAWIDPQHPNPAEPGELRWYAMIDGEDVEVENEKPFEHKGEMIHPRSRTFIPARLEDNPYLLKTDYKTVLMNTPEPLRSQLLYGDFGVSVKDDPWQVIPSAWIRESRTQWGEMFADGVVARDQDVNPVYGLDVAGGGTDDSALVKLTGEIVQWVKYSKISEPNELAKWVTQYVKKSDPIGIDAIGIGNGPYGVLRNMDYNAIPVKVSKATRIRDKTGILSFSRLRSALWWMVRDSIDPSTQTPGKRLFVCPDEKLFKDLAAPKFYKTADGSIQVESKDNIREKLGRSPDGGNALMIALYIARRPKLRIV